jgi:hypothetical protein
MFTFKKIKEWHDQRETQESIKKHKISHQINITIIGEEGKCEYYLIS